MDFPRLQKRWKVYFKDLLKATTVERSTFLDDAHTNETETEQELENDPPDILDIEITIQLLSTNKAPGMDNFPIELNKKGEQLLISMLHSLIKRMWM